MLFVNPFLSVWEINCKSTLSSHFLSPFWSDSNWLPGCHHLKDLVRLIPTPMPDQVTIWIISVRPQEKKKYSRPVKRWRCSRWTRSVASISKRSGESAIKLLWNTFDLLRKASALNFYRISHYLRIAHLWDTDKKIVT